LIELTLKEIANAAEGKIISGSEENIINSITTDSRKSGENSLFIALKGENFDGNDYAQDFLKTGCAVIVEREIKSEKGVILVSDTKKALLKLAEFYRGKFDIPIVGVTGSVGKTSTKDMIACVLSQKFNTLKTQGNFNNEIGLPLTVFNMNYENEAAVLEMGMNNLGEISRLTNIAKPKVAVITNIGTAHIGILGSQQNILKAKLEMLEQLSSDGIVVLNGDDPILYSLKGKLPFTTIYYGISNLKSDVLATDIILGSDKSKFKIEINGEHYPFEVNTIGQHHIYNALAAIIVGRYLGISPEVIKQGVASFTSGNMRQNITKIKDITILEDCYNASVSSMESALKVLIQLGGANRTIAVLGDILEQGEFAEEMHRQVGQIVKTFEISKLITFGKDAKYIAAEAQNQGMEDVNSFDTHSEVLDYLLSCIEKNDAILFKASRGMKLEEISAKLKEHLEG